MKVLFLDIDGVLNSHAWFKRRKQEGKRSDLDNEAVARLNQFLLDTDTKVVVSSAWRKIHELSRIRERLIRRGLSRKVRFLGATPALWSAARGWEIAHWLSLNGQGVTHYAIVDDDSDMLDSQQKHFVQTSWDEGLLDSHVEALKVALENPRRVGDLDFIEACLNCGNPTAPTPSLDNTSYGKVTLCQDCLRLSDSFGSRGVRFEGSQE